MKKTTLFLFFIWCGFQVFSHNADSAIRFHYLPIKLDTNTTFSIIKNYKVINKTFYDNGQIKTISVVQKSITPSFYWETKTKIIYQFDECGNLRNKTIGYERFSHCGPTWTSTDYITNNAICDKQWIKPFIY